MALHDCYEAMSLGRYLLSAPPLPVIISIYREIFSEDIIRPSVPENENCIPL